MAGSTWGHQRPFGCDRLSVSVMSVVGRIWGGYGEILHAWELCREQPESHRTNMKGTLSWRQGCRPHLPHTPGASCLQFLLSAVPGLGGLGQLRAILPRPLAWSRAGGTYSTELSQAWLGPYSQVTSPGVLPSGVLSFGRVTSWPGPETLVCCSDQAEGHRDGPAEPPLPGETRPRAQS